MYHEELRKKVVEKSVYVKMLEGSLIHGKINIGMNDRLSDVFTKGDSPFVVIYDIGEGEGPKKVLIVNKSHIVWVEPDEGL